MARSLKMARNISFPVATFRRPSHVVLPHAHSSPWSRITPSRLIASMIGAGLNKRLWMRTSQHQRLSPVEEWFHRNCVRRVQWMQALIKR